MHRATWSGVGALALLALAGSAATGFGQAPADRAALEAFRDSLAGVSDTTVLLALESHLIERARVDRGNVLLHLRLGFLAYRVGEAGGDRSHYDDAASEFEWAGEIEPDWPYPWYGLGLAELALGEHPSIAIENVRQMLGKDYLTKAANAFARATAADPDFTAAVIDLTNTALSQRINDRVAVATEAVRIAARGPAGRNPLVQLARGRLERARGEADSSVAALRAALALGADSGVALFELSRSLYFARQPHPAWEAYFAGAGATRSADAVTAYRQDVAWLASDAQLAEFDGLAGPAERADWLRRFWVTRDQDDVREVGDRLAEHNRRWLYVQRNFRLVSRRRHYDIAETYRNTQTDIDDRGIIYLRHGPPDDRASFVCPLETRDAWHGCEINESWLYRRRAGDLVFHFVAREDVQDYKLVESLVDVLGFGNAVYAQGRRDPLVQQLYATRRHFGEPYGRIGNGMGVRSGLLVEERAIGQRSIAVGTSTDSYRHRFASPLGVRTTEFVVARRDSGSPAQNIVVVFAVPVGRLTAIPAAGQVRYPLQLRMRVMDSTGRAVASLDTLRVFAAAQPLAREAYLSGVLNVVVPAGTLHYRLLVATPDDRAGDVVSRDSLPVPALDGRAVAVSDLVLGRVGSGIAWLPPGDTVPLNPLGDYAQGGSIELYYEVAGLVAGTAYRTEITLEPAGGPSLFGRVRGLFGGRRAPVRLSFDAVATGPVTRVRRSLGLGDLKRGPYVLTVAVTDPAGTTQVRRRRVEVVAATAS